MTKTEIDIVPNKELQIKQLQTSQEKRKKLVEKCKKKTIQNKKKQMKSIGNYSKYNKKMKIT